MNKKSLLFFRDDSLKKTDVKANSYVVSDIGFFFQDVSDRRAEIVLEGELSISLSDKYKVITEEEATALIEAKANPNKLYLEIEKIKEEIASLKSENASLTEENTLLKKESESLTNENTSLKEENASLKSENDSLKEQLGQVQGKEAKAKQK